MLSETKPELNSFKSEVEADVEIVEVKFVNVVIVSFEVKCSTSVVRDENCEFSFSVNVTVGDKSR